MSLKEHEGLQCFVALEDEQIFTRRAQFYAFALVWWSNLIKSFGACDEMQTIRAVGWREHFCHFLNLFLLLRGAQPQAVLFISEH